MQHIKPSIIIVLALTLYPIPIPIHSLFNQVSKACVKKMKKK